MILHQKMTFGNGISTMFPKPSDIRMNSSLPFHPWFHSQLHVLDWSFQRLFITMKIFTFIQGVTFILGFIYCACTTSIQAVGTATSNEDIPNKNGILPFKNIYFRLAGETLCGLGHIQRINNHTFCKIKIQINQTIIQ